MNNLAFNNDGNYSLRYQEIVNLANMAYQQRMQIIPKCPINKNRVMFKCELQCCKCNNKLHETMSKSKLIFMLSKDHYKDYVCKYCGDKQRHEDEIRIEVERRIKLDSFLHPNETNEYIKKFLNPKNNVNLHNSNARLELFKVEHLDGKTISDHIKRMDYNKEFLHTPYWKIISFEVKNRALNRCSVCNSTNDLQAHHRSYNTTRGREHLDWKNELICLCGKCHGLFHNANGGKK